MDLFRIVLPWEKAESPKPDTSRVAAGSSPPCAPKRVRATVAAIAVLILAGLSWWLVRQGESLTPAKAGPPRITSLAVKPLDDFSGDTSQAYLSDGMTEALCSALGNISALRVPGRSSVMRYKGGQKSIREIARELDVDAIVEGSLQRTSTNMLVTVQLIEAATDRHLWSTNYKRDLSDFFVVQSEVALAIAAEIQLRLTPRDLTHLAHARPANRAAMEACLLGMHYWWQWSDEGYTNALRYFRKAIEIDPGYAPGHAGEALTYVIAASSSWRPNEVMARARAAAEKAIELDPLLAEGFLARGTIRTVYDWDWAGGEKDFKQALELSPNSSLALDLYENLLAMQGRFAEATLLLEKALEHEPLSAGLHSDLGVTYYYSGQPELAISYLRRALELAPNFLQAHIFLGWCYQFTDKPAEALAQFETAAHIAPDSAWVKAALGYAVAKSGRHADALKILADLDQIARHRYVSSTWHAFVHVGLGEKDLALDWLEKSHAEHDNQMVALRVSPVLAPLRNEPRYQALLKKVRLDH